MDDNTVVKLLNEIRYAQVVSGVHADAICEAIKIISDANAICITDGSGKEIAVIDGDLADAIIKQSVTRFITDALENLIEHYSE
jgi:hypothetical protein